MACTGYSSQTVPRFTDYSPPARESSQNPAGAYTQGQRQLTGCSRKDFQQEVVVPGASAAFADDAVFAGMLLEQG
jgi:hypothetical protein